MKIHKKTLRGLPRHLERLRDFSHTKLWRPAEPPITSPNDGTSDAERRRSRDAAAASQVFSNETSPHRVNTTARVGFVLVYIATLAAAMSLDLFSTATSFDDVPWAPWLIALFLGSLAIAILVKAVDAIHRSMRFGRARWPVAAGLGLAAVVAFVVALPILALTASLGARL